LTGDRDIRPFVRRYYAALNSRDLVALAALITADFQHHGSGQVAGFAAFAETLKAFVAGFPDLEHTVAEVLVEGDRAAVRTVTSGTHLGEFLGHPPTGRSFRADALTVIRFERNSIREIWNVFDTIQMLQQLDLYVATAVPGSRSAPLSAADRAHAPPASERRPPGPARPVTLVEVRSAPLEFVSNLAATYGDIVAYECEGRLTYLLNTPDAVRHVLHDRATNYSKLGTPDLQLLGPMLGQGLLTTDGPIWRRDRQRLQPLFNRQRVEAFAEVIVSSTEKMLDRWTAREDPAAPLDILHEMSRLTLEIVGRALFSSDLAAESAEFGQAMEVVNSGMGQARSTDTGQLAGALDLVRRTAWQMVLSRKIFDSGEDDLVSLLLEGQRLENDSDRALADQAVTLLLAGHETTGKALSWIFALLDRNPGAGARLADEITEVLAGQGPTAANLPTLHYTRAVVSEALRLYPPVWLISRSALAPDTIEGFPVAPGTLVSMSPYLIQRHPDCWTEPLRFRPERFLETGEEAATREFRYLPFGAGPRQCIGKHFAMLELPLALAVIWQRCRLNLPLHYSLEPEALVTLRPRDGLSMTFHARASELIVSS
jgi:steroid delta-isomerase-like uncharacterized protein